MSHDDTAILTHILFHLLADKTLTFPFGIFIQPTCFCLFCRLVYPFLALVKIFNIISDLVHIVLAAINLIYKLHE